MLDQIFHDAFDVVIRVKAERVLRLLNAHFVVPEILLVVDVQTHRDPEMLFNRHLHQVSNFSHGVVAGSYVEDSRDSLAGFDRPNVSVGRVLDAEIGRQIEGLFT